MHQGQAPDLPESLRSLDGRLPGTEPLASRGSGEAWLLLHGFAGSPWEIRPLGEALAAREASVAMPLLTGHGASAATLEASTWHHWLASAREALAWLAPGSERLHLVGFSMGGLLALHLAREALPGPLASVSLLAPALCLRTGVTPALNVLRLLPWPRNVGRRDAGLPGRPAYGPIPVRAACSLLELVEVTTAVARPLAAPVLVMQGSRDLSVPCGPNLKRVEALLGHAPRLEVVAGAGHVLLREEGAASRVIEAVVAAGIRS